MNKLFTLPLRYAMGLMSLVYISSAISTPATSHLPHFTKNGLASWYGGSFFQSRKTAQGQRFDNNALTAAHRSLPFGTKVRVWSPKTHRSVIVTINDRGPFARHRIIDVSKKAAIELGMLRYGVVPVSLTVLPSLHDKHTP